jgi:hypothetical protein
MIVTSRCTELLGVVFVKYTTRRNGYTLDRCKLNPRDPTLEPENQCYDDQGECWGRSAWPHHADSDHGETTALGLWLWGSQLEKRGGGERRDSGEELNECGLVGKQRDLYWRG